MVALYTVNGAAPAAVTGTVREHFIAAEDTVW